MSKLRLTKKTKRGLVSIGISLLLVVPQTTMLFANEGATPKYSNWALGELLEGEKYGIFPISWYDQDMRRKISMEELTQLTTGLSQKIEALPGITKKVAIETRVIEGEITREDVLNAIYDVIASYSYPKDLKVSGNEGSAYMTQKEVIRGDLKGLTLNTPCTVEQAALFGTRIIDLIYDELDAGSKGLLWVAKKGDNTVYMLGSVHVANTSIYPFSEEVKEAYEKADELVLEIDLFDAEGQAELVKLQYYTDGTTVKDHLSATNYEKLTKVLKDYNLKVEDLQNAKLWAVTNTLSVLSATDATTVEEQQMASLTGIDMYLASKAYILGKPIGELESYKFQGEMMDGFSPELQQYIFESTVDSMLAAEKETQSDSFVDTLLKYWKEGNVEGIKEYVFPEDVTPKEVKGTKEIQLQEEYQSKFWTQRDKGMADKIAQMLNAEGSKTYFVVVGAGHYISDTGVIAQLKDKGFEVTQVK